MKKYRWMYLIIVILALAGYIGTDKKQMLLLLVCLLCVGGSSIGIWLFTFRKVKICMEVEDISRMGRPLSLKIVVDYDGKLPIGSIVLLMEYENRIFSDTDKQLVMLKPGRKSRVEYKVPYEARNCGKTCVRIQAARIYDLLGIVYLNMGKEQEKEIIIYPDVKNLEIQRKNLPEAKNQGETHDTIHKGLDVSETFDMRDYQEGDSVKSIHWKLSGKMDKLIIREFGKPTNYHTALFYDTGVDDNIEIEQKRKLQNAVMQMTASVSKAMIQKAYSHYLLTIEDGNIRETIVENNETYFQMLAEMMCRRVLQNSEEEEQERQFLEAETKFTKLVIVCCSIHMEWIQQISRQTNLTVLFINSKGEEGVENGNNYTIINISLKRIDTKLRLIEL